MDNMEVEIPDAMVEYEADNLVNDMAQRIQAQGIPFDQYLAMTRHDHGYHAGAGQGRCSGARAP